MPASNFKTKSEHKRTLYTYENRDVKISLEASGEFKIKIKHADLSIVDNDQMGYIRLDIDSVFADTRATLKCHENFCATTNEHDHDSQDRDER